MYAKDNIGATKPRWSWWGFAIRWVAVGLVFALLVFVLWSSF